MPEAPLTTLRRWEDAGAHWRVLWAGPDEAIVELLSCLGEPVDQVRSGDAELLAYLADRSTSQAE